MKKFVIYFKFQQIIIVKCNIIIKNKGEIMKYKYDEEVLNIDLDEELDMNTCKTLRTIIDGYIMRYQPKEFVFNLSNVKFMDSSGLGLIIGRYNLLNLINSKMVIVNPNNSIKRVLELSNISRNITMRCD